MKGSVIIVLFFAAGIAFGTQGLGSALIDNGISFYVLCALMFCVGVGIGSDSEAADKFRNINPRLALLPVVTILGTLAGCSVASALFPERSLSDCLAVGSGFGYYSLSSIFITEYRGPELGTVALLANIVREMAALLCAPLLVKWFGKLAPISAGGATTMDTTLPIITRCSGTEFAVLSVFHGFIVDFSVPFLVTLFCKAQF